MYILRATRTAHGVSLPAPAAGPALFFSIASTQRNPAQPFSFRTIIFGFWVPSDACTNSIQVFVAARQPDYLAAISNCRAFYCLLLSNEAPVHTPYWAPLLGHPLAFRTLEPLREIAPQRFGSILGLFFFRTSTTFQRRGRL